MIEFDDAISLVCDKLVEAVQTAAPDQFSVAGEIEPMPPRSGDGTDVLFILTLGRVDSQPHQIIRPGEVSGAASVLTEQEQADVDESIEKLRLGSMVAEFMFQEGDYRGPPQPIRAGVAIQLGGHEDD